MESSPALNFHNDIVLLSISSEIQESSNSGLTAIFINLILVIISFALLSIYLACVSSAPTQSAGDDAVSSLPGSSHNHNETPVDEIPSILPLEDQPKIIGGPQSISKYLKYPEAAKKAGIEGVVVVSALVDKEGLVESVCIEKTFGNDGCTDAAVEAVKMLKFITRLQPLFSEK